MARRHTPGGYIFATFAIAIFLTIIPIPEGWQWFRPYWLAMILIFWVVEAPEQVGLGVAFAAGLILDFTAGSLLAQHALSLVIIAYISARLRLRMRFFPLWQQALVVLGVLLNDRFIYFLVQGLSGRGLPDWHILWAPFVAMLVWPWLFLLIDALNQKVRRK